MNVLVIGLGRFTRVNDHLGHGAGDDVLRHVGGGIAQTAGCAVSIGRVGGDELIVILMEPPTQGGNLLRFYTADNFERDSEASQAESALDWALDNGAFDVHYQPKVEIQSWYIVGAEALVRWDSRDSAKSSRNVSLRLPSVPVCSRHFPVGFFGRPACNTAHGTNPVGLPGTSASIFTVPTAETGALERVAPDYRRVRDYRGCTDQEADLRRPGAA